MTGLLLIFIRYVRISMTSIRLYITSIFFLNVEYMFQFKLNYLTANLYYSSEEILSNSKFILSFKAMNHMGRVTKFLLNFRNNLCLDDKRHQFKILGN